MHVPYNNNRFFVISYFKFSIQWSLVPVYHAFCTGRFLGIRWNLWWKTNLSCSGFYSCVPLHQIDF